jgi:hypothetical protein
MDSAANDFQWRRAALDQIGRLAAVPSVIQPRPLSDTAFFSTIRRNFGCVDHDLATLVLPAYRLLEQRETPGSISPANRSQ